MNAKRHFTPLILPSILLICAGCELAGPLLIGEATKGEDDLGASSASLTVEIESASGVVAGRTIAPEMFTATGDRFGDQVSFHLLSEDGDLEVLVLSQAESSSTNPYTGEGPDEGGSAGIPIPATPDGPAFGPEPFADLTLCELGSCRNATDFGVELVQTEAGRDVVVDGVWGADESLRITLHYAENR